MKYSKFRVISSAVAGAAGFMLLKRLKEVRRREVSHKELLKEKARPVRRLRDDQTDKPDTQEFYGEKGEIKMEQFSADYYIDPDNPLVHPLPGDIFRLGHYPQNGDKAAPIEWLVLDRKDNEVLLLSLYGLDCQPYDVGYKSFSWENSSIREWLNSTFYKTSFSAQEQGMIMKTAADKYAYPHYDETPGDSIAADKVFLLNETDAALLLDSAETRLCRATGYAIGQGTFTSEDGYSPWLLRNTEAESESTWCVGCTGLILPFPYFEVSDNCCCIRPAVRINMDVVRCAEDDHNVWSVKPKDCGCLIREGEFVSLKDREGNSAVYQVTGWLDIDGYSCVYFTGISGNFQLGLIAKEIGGEYVEVMFGRHYVIDDDDELLFEKDN